MFRPFGLLLIAISARQASVAKHGRCARMWKDVRTDDNEKEGRSETVSRRKSTHIEKTGSSKEEDNTKTNRDAHRRDSRQSLC